MRLTINLADDVYAVARALAKEGEFSISHAVNQLIRRGLQPPKRVSTDPESEREDGLPIVEGRRPFTSDDVYRLERENG